MPKSVIKSPKLSQPRGIFSHGTKAGNLVFISGMVAFDAQGQVVGKGDIKVQTRQALENIKAALEEAGAILDDVTKVTVYVTNIVEHFSQIHEVRAQYFTKDYPASTMVEVKALAHPDLLIEIEAIAVTS